MPGATTERLAPALDLEAARKAIAEAGDVGELTLLVRTGTFIPELGIADAVRRQLEAVGLKVRIVTTSNFTNDIKSKDGVLRHHLFLRRIGSDYAHPQTLLTPLQASGNKALGSYETQRLDGFGPDDNRQVPSLRWMLERARDRGVRAVVVFFPENPAFRDPDASAFYDAELSAAYDEVFAAETAAAGARFVDLRDLLPAEDFHDFIHPNLAGMRKPSQRLAEIVAEEWRTRDAGGGAAAR